MIIMTRPAMMILSSALALACAEAQPQPLLDIGDPCRAESSFCVDDETLQTCVDDAWAQRDCESVCAEQGPAWVAGGCDYECMCIPADANACAPGATQCGDEATLEACSEVQAWESFACDELCDAQGLASLGCMAGEDSFGEPLADCWCTLEGTACEPDAMPACVDAGTLGQCVGGVWVFEDCAASCGGAGQCGPWGEPPQCMCA